MRFCLCLFMPAVCFFIFHYQPDESQVGNGEQRLYTDSRLAEAREALRDYTFKDERIGEAFARNNEKVVAVLLEIGRKGADIKELKVYVNYRGEKNLNLLKILDNSNDPDFKALVDKLKIRG